MPTAGSDHVPGTSFVCSADRDMLVVESKHVVYTMVASRMSWSKTPTVYWIAGHTFLGDELMEALMSPINQSGERFTYMFCNKYEHSSNSQKTYENSFNSDKTDDWNM